VFGPAVNLAGPVHRVASAVAHPDFDPQTLGHDVALVFLDDPAPEPPVALRADPAVVVGAGSSVRVVGFGRTSPDDNEPARKRSGTATVSAVDEEDLALVPAPSLPCSGDSGGPVLADDRGAPTIVGVISRGDVACAQAAHAARTDAAMASFLAPALANSAPGAIAVGKPCHYDANCASAHCYGPPDAPRHRYCTTACSADRDCPFGLACDGACRYPPPSPGAPGSACAADADCENGFCLGKSSAGAACVAPCAVGILPCPADHECVVDAARADRSGCVPLDRSAPAGGSDCAFGRRGGRDGAATTVALLLLWSIASRNQRRQRRQVDAKPRLGCSHFHQGQG
jgi:hypothetical protein